MTLYQKIKDVIILICIVVAIFGFLKMKSDLQYANEQLITTQQSLVEVKLEMGKIQAQTIVMPANSDEWKDAVEKVRKENAAIYAMMKKQDEKLTNIGQIVSSIPATHTNDQPSTTVVNVPSTDPNSTVTYKEYSKDITIPAKNSEGKDTELPIAWAKFKDQTKLWDSGTYALKYNVSVIQSERENGTINSYITSSIEDAHGVTAPLEVNAKFIQTKLTEKKMFWFAPKLSLNADINNRGNGGGGLSCSMSSYGRTKIDSSWKFLEIGVSTNGDEAWLKFMPASWNAGDVIPGISNTFISPYIGIDKEGTNFGIGLSVPF
jgi:hypothetical protein